MTIELVPDLPTRNGHLSEWAATFAELAGVSVALAPTPFVPASLRGDTAKETAANIQAAILTGDELGLSPMASLRSINVINGTPALAALALRALVQREGHEVWVEEATATRAIVAGSRAGSEHVQRVTWSMEDARSRGLAGKLNWRTQPRNMLVARATSELCRQLAADVILGVPYSAEELEDGDDITVMEAVAPVPAKKRTARRRAAVLPPPALAPVGLDEPPLDEPSSPPEPPESPPEPPEDAPAPPVYEPAVEDPVGRIHPDQGAMLPDPNRPASRLLASPGQVRAIQTLFTKSKLRYSREEKLRYCANLIGHDVDSSKELTMREADTVLAALEDLVTALGEDEPEP